MAPDNWYFGGFGGGAPNLPTFFHINKILGTPVLNLYPSRSYRYLYEKNIVTAQIDAFYYFVLSNWMELKLLDLIPVHLEFCEASNLQQKKTTAVCVKLWYGIIVALL